MLKYGADDCRYPCEMKGRKQMEARMSSRSGRTHHVGSVERWHGMRPNQSHEANHPLSHHHLHRLTPTWTYENRSRDSRRRSSTD